MSTVYPISMNVRKNLSLDGIACPTSEDCEEASNPLQKDVKVIVTKGGSQEDPDVKERLTRIEELLQEILNLI